MPPREEVHRQWFGPIEGIEGNVIATDIPRYLGNDATVQPGAGPIEHLGVNGYWIKAYHNLTSATIEDLRADSHRWSQEQRQAGVPACAYVGSDTFNRTNAAGVSSKASLRRTPFSEDHLTWQNETFESRDKPLLKIESRVRPASELERTYITPPPSYLQPVLSATGPSSDDQNRNLKSNSLPSSKYQIRDIETTKAFPLPFGSASQPSPKERTNEYHEAVLSVENLPNLERRSKKNIDRGQDWHQQLEDTALFPSALPSKKSVEFNRHDNFVTDQQPAESKLLVNNPRSPSIELTSESSVSYLRRMRVEHEMSGTDDENESLSDETDTREDQGDCGSIADQFTVFSKGLAGYGETSGPSDGVSSSQAAIRSTSERAWGSDSGKSSLKRNNQDEEDDGVSRPRKVQKQDDDADGEDAVTAEIIPCFEVGCPGQNRDIFTFVRKLGSAHGRFICTRCWNEIQQDQFSRHGSHLVCDDNCVCEKGQSRCHAGDLAVGHKPSEGCSKERKRLKWSQYVHICRMFSKAPLPFKLDVTKPHRNEKPRPGNRNRRSELLAASQRVAEESETLKTENEKLRAENEKLEIDNEEMTSQIKNDAVKIKELQNIVMTCIERLEEHMPIPRSLIERVKEHAPNALTPSITSSSLEDTVSPTQEGIPQNPELSKCGQAAEGQYPFLQPLEDIDEFCNRYSDVYGEDYDFPNNPPSWRTD